MLQHQLADFSGVNPLPGYQIRKSFQKIFLLEAVYGYFIFERINHFCKKIFMSRLPDATTSSTLFELKNIKDLDLVKNQQEI